MHPFCWRFGLVKSPSLALRVSMNGCTPLLALRATMTRPRAVRHAGVNRPKPTALVWRPTSDRLCQSNALEPQQPPCASVVALASQGVAALMVVDLGGQLFQERPGNP